jgi:cytochrome-b5 reductase
LDTLAKTYPDRFKITYVLEKGPENYKHSGFINADLLKQEVPAPGTESFITFVCGPPPFMEAISGDKNPDKSQGTLRGYFKE